MSSLGTEDPDGRIGQKEESSSSSGELSSVWRLRWSKEPSPPCAHPSAIEKAGNGATASDGATASGPVLSFISPVIQIRRASYFKTKISCVY